MKTTTIKFSLTNKGVDKAIRQLEEYKKRIIKRLQTLLDVMCMDGEDYACQYLTHIDTGETHDSIMGYREGNRGIIEVGGNAIWIEFGTGTTKNVMGDPFHENRYELGINNWGGFGMGQGDDPNGWWYWKDNKWNHTYGIMMQPFMHNTAMQLRETFRDNAERVFKR